MFDVAICDIKAASSSRVNWKQNSSGKRAAFLFPFSLRRRISTRKAIELGLIAGKYVLYGGVVRNKKVRIAKHLKAVRAQNLNEKAVRDLMEAVEELQAQLGGEEAQVEISGKQFARFVSTVHAFTIKFNEANGSKASKVVCGDAPIRTLHRDLASQLQIFQLAA